ncbi:MAG: glucose-6-phosphate dehydrogenase [Ardenticatenaceae bacterium]|nr:glucose-6-phosphate dehydrogenase [Ardenticatenaceae bacterium]
MPSSNPTIVIFGASGDLTRRKLVPALYNLYQKHRLPTDFRIVGYARSDMTSEVFRSAMREAVIEFATLDEPTWASFASRLYYVCGQYDDPAGFENLRTILARLEPEGAGRLYYLSTPPKLYATIVQCLGTAQMTGEKQSWRRVVIEKPFGQDLASAQELNRSVHTVLDEKQIYRIDHYLGKETVQNLLVFRFANAIFEPIWNRNYISNVQITAAESVDVAHRAGYYDGVGVLRDMFQNHLMQLLALTSMEPPASFDADALRNEKVKVFAAIRPYTTEEVAYRTVRGQYRTYRDAEGVAPRSETPTYAALQISIDNWRWQGVPFYLRSGKALQAKTTEIVIRFKRPPHMMFPIPAEDKLRSNYLAICVQPDEGIHLRFEAKQPDTAAGMRSVDMEFHYDEAFGPRAIPEAYERLLLDALNGDAALFTRADEIELSWRLMDSVLRGWESPQAAPLAFYESGSWGPDEADKLLARDNHHWTQGCSHTPTTP